MGNTKNPFIEKIKNNSIVNEKELDSLYRQLAKKTHPDLNSNPDCSSFVALRNYYNEAKKFFRTQVNHTLCRADDDRKFFLDNFNRLLTNNHSRVALQDSNSHSYAHFCLTKRALLEFRPDMVTGFEHFSQNEGAYKTARMCMDCYITGSKYPALTIAQSYFNEFKCNDRCSDHFAKIQTCEFLDFLLHEVKKCRDERG